MYVLYIHSPVIAYSLWTGYRITGSSRPFRIKPTLDKIASPYVTSGPIFSLVDGAYILAYALRRSWGAHSVTQRGRWA